MKVIETTNGIHIVEETSDEARVLKVISSLLKETYGKSSEAGSAGQTPEEEKWEGKMGHLLRPAANGFDDSVLRAYADRNKPPLLYAFAGQTVRVQLIEEVTGRAIGEPQNVKFDLNGKGFEEGGLKVTVEN